jgi:preprotein translocase subunit YajC
LITNAYAQGLIPGGGDLMSLLPIVVVFGLLYFMMIRPQVKRQKEHKVMLEGLQKGDEVIASGILGKVVELGDSFVTLEVSKNQAIQVQKQAVTTLLPKGTIKSAS